MENFWIEHRLSADNYHLPCHYEHCYQVLFLLNGRVLYRVGEKEYSLGRGSMVLLNTLEEHSLEVLEYPYERILFQISPIWFQHEIRYPGLIAAFVKRDAAFSHMLTVREPAWEQLRAILGEILQETTEKKEYWELALGGNLRRFFVCLERECPEAFAKEKASAQSALAYRVLHYLDGHFTEEITIDGIAEKMYLNRHYISHVFKTETGYSMTEYILSLRMSRAKELLTQTGESISDISMKCGYTDFAYFARVFRKNTGYSPRAFRKEHGNPEAYAEK